MADATEWEWFFALIRRILIDDSSARGLLMRRRVAGKWQYRRMTGSEQTDYSEGAIW